MDNPEKIEVPTPFDIGDVNCYVFDEDRCTLVDPGPMTSEAYETLVTRLNELGYAVPDIDRILLTHPHIDHFGLISKLKEESRADLMAHTDATYRLTDPETYLENEQKYFLPFLVSMGVPEQLADTIVGLPESYTNFQDPVIVDRELTDGDVITLGDDYRVVHTPGHSPGSVCFISETSNIAFTGDHILMEVSPNPLLTLAPNTTNERTRSLPQYVCSLKKVHSWDIKTGYSGHKSVVVDVNSRIEEILAHHHQRKERIAEILSIEGPTTAYSILQDMFSSLPATKMFAGMSEVIGHLDLLEEEDRIDISHNDGTSLYTLR